MKNKQYGLIFMAFDGDYVCERKSFDDPFYGSIKEAWEYADDRGSRWFFYPFVFILAQDGKTIADAGDLNYIFKRKTLTYVRMVFKTVSELPATERLEPFEFMHFLETWVEENL